MPPVRSTDSLSRRPRTRIPLEGERVASTAGCSGTTRPADQDLLDDHVDLPFARRQTSFRVCCNNLLVTYPQAEGCDVDGIVAVLRRANLEFQLGRERHADGGVHYHAFCRRVGGGRFESTNARILDVRCGGMVYHPNIRVIYRTPELAWDYVGKDGDIVGEDFGREDCEVVSAGQRSKAAWNGCFDA